MRGVVTSLLSKQSSKSVNRTTSASDLRRLRSSVGAHRSHPALARRSGEAVEDLHPSYVAQFPESTALREAMRGRARGLVAFGGLMIEWYRMYLFRKVQEHLPRFASQSDGMAGNEPGSASTNLQSATIEGRLRSTPATLPCQPQTWRPTFQSKCCSSSPESSRPTISS